MIRLWTLPKKIGLSRAMKTHPLHNPSADIGVPARTGTLFVPAAPQAAPRSDNPEGLQKEVNRDVG